ncbi:hypothetical protein [Vibrio alginolyticus]|uniref:hypothetical protein n=1 Tax=Vibrio alginolyticus TaxID=663 RepID=UPI0006CA6F6F|nr:hypothetical protein [Vibrio alginolyticus]KPM95054.1 hypothetical protein AOG25_26560 [Vibrio alginolyticus]
MSRLRQISPDRNSYGEWIHPDFPKWEDWIPNDELNEWCNMVGIKVHWIELEDDANSEEIADRYFEKNDIYALRDWSPSLNITGAFLIAIFDSEVGPRAAFAEYK